MARHINYMTHCAYVKTCKVYAQENLDMIWYEFNEEKY